MKKYPITIFFAFQLIFGCTSPTQPAPDISKDFHLPVVTEKPALNNIEYTKVDSLTQVYFKFVDKFKFADTVKLEFDNEGYFKYGDQVPPSDFLNERYKPKPKDSLTTDGFQIVPDYKTSIYYKEPYDPTPFCYFPVYVVNETSTTKVFFAKDSYVFAIQEAIDTTEGWEHWRPIEAKGFDFCGNGAFGLKVHPGEFVMFLVPKYEGQQKAPMRIRLRIGESLYISGSYQGTFNAKQFNVSKASWFHKYLVDPKEPYRFERFYGAIPKGYDPQ